MFHLPIANRGMPTVYPDVPWLHVPDRDNSFIKCACSMAERACGKQSMSLGIYRRHNQTWAKRKHFSLYHIKNSAESINSYLRYAPWKLAIFIRECVVPVLAFVVTSVTDRDEHVAVQADSSLRA